MVGAAIGVGIGIYLNEEATESKIDGIGSSDENHSGDSSPGEGERPENQSHPAETAESISKAQEKLRKRDKEREWDKEDEWGDLPRPKGCPIDSTKKSTGKNWTKYWK